MKHLPVYLETGTRDEYAKYRRWHAELPPEARTAGFYLLDQTERLKRVFLHDHGGRPEETSVAAWDVTRAVHYAGLGWGAGVGEGAGGWERAGPRLRDTVSKWPFTSFLAIGGLDNRRLTPCWTR